MWKWVQSAKQKLGIPSGRAIIHVVIVEIVINLVWNWVSNRFTVPLVREIGFLFVFVAGLFAVAWYLPKLAPVYTGRKIITETTQPLRVQHDGVLWEDTGKTYAGSGRIVVGGPLCPNDLTPLALTDGEEVDTNVDYDSYISDCDYQLVCIKCKTEYFLEEEPKQLQKSRNEAGNLLEGIKRREQENKAST